MTLLIYKPDLPGCSGNSTTKEVIGVNPKGDAAAKFSYCIGDEKTAYIDASYTLGGDFIESISFFSGIHNIFENSLGSSNIENVDLSANSIYSHLFLPRDSEISNLSYELDLSGTDNVFSSIALNTDSSFLLTQGNTPITFNSSLEFILNGDIGGANNVPAPSSTLSMALLGAAAFYVAKKLLK